MSITIAANIMSIKTGAAVASFTSGSINSNVSGSGFFVGVLSKNTTAEAITVSDSNGNGYTHIGSQVYDGSGVAIDRFYCASGTGSTTHTATAHTAAGTANFDIFFGEIVSLLASPSYDVSSTVLSGFGGNPHNVANLTLTAANTSNGELLISCFGTEAFSPASVTVANGFTILATDISNGAVNGGWAYKVVNAAGSYGVQWADGASQFVLGSLDAFVGGTGGGLLPTVFRMYANGAFQANAFVQATLPANTAMRLYSNNVVHVANLNINGAGAIRLFANGQLTVNSTIIV
jgi:hypothetical protein